ncbi:MAG: hypothetical protein ACSLE7_06025 [Mycobacterium sp.]
MSRQFSPYSTTRDSYSGSGYRSEQPIDHAAGHQSDRARRRAARHGAGYGRVRRETHGAYDSHDAHDGYEGYEGYIDDGDSDTDYPDYRFPADYHEPLDRRWIWVAGVAGVILMVAVICTGVILGGGDSGTVSAGATSSEAAAPTAPMKTAAPSAAEPAPGVPALPPETVTTMTPSPSASAVPTAEPTPSAPVPAPALAEAPVADPALAARTITYHVTGNRSLIDLITVIYTDRQGALQTDVNVALPWVKTVTLDPGVTLTSVTATSVGGQVNCSIVDGSGAAIAVQANNSMIATCTR